MVWRVVSRILNHREDSLDCFQDVFAEAIRRGRHKQVNDWGAFLCWLATRRAIDHLRRRQRRVVANESLELVRDPAPAAGENLRFEELVDRIRNELGELPVKQAEAFWMVCVEDRTYAEVAAQMGVERNLVGVLVHRARQQMRSRLRSLRPSVNREKGVPSRED